MRSGLFTLAVVAFSVAASAATATPWYLRSSDDLWDPEGGDSNVAAMNDVFGSGAWTAGEFETVAPGTLFSTASFIFMDGSDQGAEEMATFLSDNSVALASFVGAGGRVFLNSAPNEGGDFSMGFGVTLDQGEFCGFACDADDPGHPIFNGPFGPVGTSFEGNSFSHAVVAGADTPLISFAEGAILGESTFGTGLALFGGMTTANFHDPQPQANNLRRNILAYAADVTPRRSDVPLPGAAALLALGLAGLGAVARRRSKA